MSLKGFWFSNPSNNLLFSKFIVPFPLPSSKLSSILNSTTVLISSWVSVHQKLQIDRRMDTKMHGWMNGHIKRFVVGCFYFILYNKLYFYFNFSTKYQKCELACPSQPFYTDLINMRTCWELVVMGQGCGSCLGLHYLHALSSLCPASLLPIKLLQVNGSLSHPNPPLLYHWRITGSILCSWTNGGLK